MQKNSELKPRFLCRRMYQKCSPWRAVQLALEKVRRLQTRPRPSCALPNFTHHTCLCQRHVKSNHWSHICKNSAVIRSRDAELPLEKVECGEADADAHRSLDPVHAQALEQPCHSLFFQHALCTAARIWKSKARVSAEVRVSLDRIAGASSLANGKKQTWAATHSPRTAVALSVENPHHFSRRLNKAGRTFWISSP